MSENATREATVTPLTPENAREAFMTASGDFLDPFCEEAEQPKLRETLLQILQNNDRDVLGACVNNIGVIAAFTFAASGNDVDLLQAFHDIGMNVDVKNQDGKTALIEASARNCGDSVRWLLDHGANVDTQNNYGSTALMYASQCGEAKIVEMLLQKNANPDIQNKYGYTALIQTSMNGHKDVVQVLLNYNADVELKNNDGKTALDLVTNEDIKEMIRNHVTTSYVLK